MTASFGKELLSRIKKEYTYQARFAEEIGVKEASVAQWISGKTYPNKENLIKICEVLSLDQEEVEDLIEREKRQKVLLRYNAEPDALASSDDLEYILKTFYRLPLSKKAKVLREMNESFYAAIGSF